MTEYSPEDYINYRLIKAKETIEEVDILIKNKLWNTAVNRMYYASFYAVGALLIKYGLSARRHAGTRYLFGQHFVKTRLINRNLAKHYTDLFEKRNKGDYNDFYDYDEETVLRLLPQTKQLIQEIEKLIRK